MVRLMRIRWGIVRVIAATILAVTLPEAGVASTPSLSSSERVDNSANDHHGTLSNPTRQGIAVWVTGANPSSGSDELVLGHRAARGFLDQYWHHAGGAEVDL